ncbi:uncharacterized protein ANIA_10684 [Aspergillus nidulans FGSC A4]|uniref:Uncharacterized protein n=1 Tax=Emericella nidulans (strain FGSC A4 / ATCC 38163 / CBS 112.46 / NRRL 194 / M139) TaxID=227321 RepID=C8VGA7_EMENI|nr:hypothetical protein [Aspergillus nidulans FGSC A4]CBF81772.1 TPA: hypothetical protein ANIA_10684 [Aspergillus nidulans FGSC A4]
MRNANHSKDKPKRRNASRIPRVAISSPLLPNNQPRKSIPLSLNRHQPRVLDCLPLQHTLKPLLPHCKRANDLLLRFHSRLQPSPLPSSPNNTPLLYPRTLENLASRTNFRMPANIHAPSNNSLVINHRKRVYPCARMNDRLQTNDDII